MEMVTKRADVSVCHILWTNVAILLMAVGCTASQPVCSALVDPELLTRAEGALFKLFEDSFDRENADALLRTYEIKDARKCGDDLNFEYWPKSGVVGTVYRMSYDITTGEAKVSGVE
jgi:hypothetical protein